MADTCRLHLLFFVRILLGDVEKANTAVRAAPILVEHVVRHFGELGARGGGGVDQIEVEVSVAVSIEPASAASGGFDVVLATASAVAAAWRASVEYSR